MGKIQSIENDENFLKAQIRELQSGDKKAIDKVLDQIALRYGNLAKNHLEVAINRYKMTPEEVMRFFHKMVELLDSKQGMLEKLKNMKPENVTEEKSTEKTIIKGQGLYGLVLTCKKVLKTSQKEVEKIKKENNILEQENKVLEKENKVLEQENKNLKKQNKSKKTSQKQKRKNEKKIKQNEQKQKANQKKQEQNKQKIEQNNKKIQHLEKKQEEQKIQLKNAETAWGKFQKENPKLSTVIVKGLEIAERLGTSIVNTAEEVTDYMFNKAGSVGKELKDMGKKAFSMIGSFFSRDD